MHLEEGYGFFSLFRLFFGCLHSAHLFMNVSTLLHPFIGTNFCELRQLWLNFPISMQIICSFLYFFDQKCNADDVLKHVLKPEGKGFMLVKLATFFKVRTFLLAMVFFGPGSNVA